MGQVPGDGFSFSVRVTCQKDFLGIFGFFFQRIDQVTLAADVDILGFVVVLKVDGHG